MVSMAKKAAVVMALVLSIYLKAQAEDVELEKIVVTPSNVQEESSGSGRNVDVVTSKEIQRSQARDVSEVITKSSSVNISDYGGMGVNKSVRMRGSTASQVLVLVDGRPINNPRDGEADLSTVALENVDRIEVLHGPGSSLYGAGAMGGTVNIITKNPPKEKQTTELSSSFGTFRTYAERFSHGARVGKFGYLLNGEFLSSQGYRPNSKYEAKDCNTKLEYKLNDYNIVHLNGGFYRSRLGLPGSTVDFDIDDKQDNLRNFYDLGWKFTPNEKTGFFIRSYQNYDRLAISENTAGSIFDTAFNKDIHSTIARGLEAQFNARLSEYYQGVCGFNYVKNLNDSTTSAKHGYVVRAGYIENKFDLFDKLNLNLGARFDDYSNFGSQLSPSFSAAYKPKEFLNIHALASRSFRAPTFNDLFWPDQGWAKGNPDLAPEKGTTYEVGFDAQVTKRIDSGITYYRSVYSNLINWEDVGGVWQPKNVNSAVINGIEFENKIAISDNLKWNVNYTFLSAKDTQTHNYLVYQPRYKVDSSLKYKAGGGFAFEFKGQFTDSRYYDAENISTVKRFYVFGLNASKQIKKGLSCFMSIDNLLNRKYQVLRNYPMPGFSFTTGVKAEF